MFLHFVRDSPKLTAITKGLYHYRHWQTTWGIKPRNTARARNGGTNVKHPAIINLDCQSLKNEKLLSYMYMRNANPYSNIKSHLNFLRPQNWLLTLLNIQKNKERKRQKNDIDVEEAQQL